MRAFVILVTLVLAGCKSGVHDGSNASPAVATGGADAGSGPQATDGGTPAGMAPADPASRTCAGRLYSIPGVPSIDGPVPCAGLTCIESAPGGMGYAYVVGEHGALWLISDGMTGASVASFLRQDGNRWVSMCPPAIGNVVTSASGTRSDDIWVGGFDRFAHWDGRAWTVMPTPVPGRVGALFGGAHEAFASVYTSWAARSGKLLHWDGATWRDTGETAELVAWADGAGRAWAIALGGVLLEWNGSGWDAVANVPSGVEVSGVWAPPNGDLFVLGRMMPARTPVVFRRTAGKFVDLSLQTPYDVYSLWIRGSSATDIWVATRDESMQGGPTVRRWDGAHWSVMGTSQTAPLVLAGGEALVYWGALQRLDGTQAAPPLATPGIGLQTASGAADQAWLGGSSGLFRVAGHSLVEVAPMPSSVISLDVRAPDDVWVENGAGEIFHWEGTTLRPIVPPAGGWSMGHVTSAGPGSVWSVGSRLVNGDWGDRTAWRWDGAWTSIPTPAMAFVTDVGSTGNGDLWVLNSDCVWQYDGTKWLRHDMPGQGLRVISVGGSDDVWVSGLGLRHFDGTSWQDSGPLTVQAFGRAARDDVWAVASPRPDAQGMDLWHWDGRAWTAQHEALLPLALAPVGGGEIWGAGGGSVLHRRAKGE